MSKGKKFKCFHCHKEGHFRRDCYEKRNQNKEKLTRIQAEAVVVTDEGF